jgi:hypothetical protein
MSFAPNKFISNINQYGGLARPNRYEVILPLPQYINKFVTNSVVDRVKAVYQSTIQNLQFSLAGVLGEVLGQDPIDPQAITANPQTTRHMAFVCEAAELPGKTIRTHDAQIYGPGFKVPYQAAYNDMNLTFLCTNDFVERKLFDRWMESMIPSDTNNPRYPRGETSRYMTNITITQYDEFINRIYVIQLIDAFPIGIAPQQLAWADDNFSRLTVNFAYQRYKVVYDQQFGRAGDVTAKLAELFGVKAQNLVS